MCPPGIRGGSDRRDLSHHTTASPERSGALAAALHALQTHKVSREPGTAQTSVVARAATSKAVVHHDGRQLDTRHTKSINFRIYSPEQRETTTRLHARATSPGGQRTAHTTHTHTLTDTARTGPCGPHATRRRATSDQQHACTRACTYPNRYTRRANQTILSRGRLVARLRTTYERTQMRRGRQPPSSQSTSTTIHPAQGAGPGRRRTR